MQLFNLLKQAQQNGPNEDDQSFAAAQQQERVRHESNAASKGGNIQNMDAKVDGESEQSEEAMHEAAYEQMPIQEVTRELEQTRLSEEEQAYDAEDAAERRRAHQQESPLFLCCGGVCC